MYLEHERFTWPKPLNGYISNINQVIVKEEIKNKKIKLLDEIDSLISQGYNYEDILKAIEIHKNLEEQ